MIDYKDNNFEIPQIEVPVINVGKHPKVYLLHKIIFSKLYQFLRFINYQ